MKILFTRFPLESAYGGAEIQTISLMKGLTERGHAVAFAGSCPVLLEMCKKENIPFADVQIGPPPVSKWGTISFAWRKQRMQRILHHLVTQFEGLDIVCMLSLSEKLLITKKMAKTGTRVVWIEHDRVGRWLEHNPWLPLLREQSRYAVTVPVSHMSGKIYEGLGWDPATIKPIPNGIDAARFNNDAGVETFRRNVSTKNGIHLLCIARLSPEKGVDVLIEAMAGLPDSFTLEIAGTGHEEQALKVLVEKLDLADRVTFSGHQKDLREVYARADALVLPSRDNDPFGLVAAEAMLQDIPVLVTDQCGIAGYLQDGKDAIIAKADSISALKDAIKRLPAEGEKLAAAGRKTAEEKFSMKRMVSEYEHVFTETSPNPSR